jgi:hypothetical protein
MISPDRLAELTRGVKHDEKSHEFRLFFSIEQAQTNEDLKQFLVRINGSRKTLWGLLRVEYNYWHDVLGVGGIEIPIAVWNKDYISRWPALVWMASQNEVQFNSTGTHDMSIMWSQLGMKFGERDENGFQASSLASNYVWLTVGNLRDSGKINHETSLTYEQTCILSAAIVCESLPETLRPVTFIPSTILSSPVPPTGA